MAAIWLLIVLLGGFATYLGRHRGGRSAPPIPSAWQRSRAAAWMYTVFALWLRWSGLYPKLITLLPQLIRYCMIVYGRGDAPDPAYPWAVKGFAFLCLGMVAAVAALLAEADPAIAALAAGFAALAPLLLWRDLMSRVERRRLAFVSELPAFIHKLSLLMAAGETMLGAWKRAAEAGPEKRRHPLYVELGKTLLEIEQGVPFPRALEEMHRRCGYHELSTLVTTVLMNYKRGGDAFALALQDASRLMLEKKQAAIRTKGEQASSKLLFPLMLMLFAVMLIVAAPAVMMMGGSSE